MPVITYSSAAMSDSIKKLLESKTSFEEAIKLVDGNIAAIQDKWSGTDANEAAKDFKIIQEDMQKILGNIDTINTILSTVSQNMSENKY